MSIEKFKIVTSIRAQFYQALLHFSLPLQGADGRASAWDYNWQAILPNTHCNLFPVHLFVYTLMHNLKTIGSIWYSTYWTTLLLLETFLFSFSAVCEFWLVSYDPKHASQVLSDVTFYVYFKHWVETLEHLKPYYTPKGLPPIKDALFVFETAKQLQTTSYSLLSRSTIVLLK